MVEYHEKNPVNLQEKVRIYDKTVQSLSFNLEILSFFLEFWVYHLSFFQNVEF